MILLNSEKAEAFIAMRVEKGATRAEVLARLADRSRVLLTKGPITANTPDAGELALNRVTFELVEPIKGGKSRVLPANADHASGLTAAVDVAQELGLSAHALVVWVYLLRHAGKDPRRRLELSYSVIGVAVGLSRWRVRPAVRELRAAGLLVVDRPGVMGRAGGQATLSHLPRLVPDPATAGELGQSRQGESRACGMNGRRCSVERARALPIVLTTLARGLGTTSPPLQEPQQPQARPSGHRDLECVPLVIRGPSKHLGAGRSVAAAGRWWRLAGLYRLPRAGACSLKRLYFMDSPGLPGAH